MVYLLFVFFVSNNRIMRPRALPYTISLCVLLIVFFYPLFEFELEWNYVDWESAISPRSGSAIMRITEELSNQRVPGIEPEWKQAHVFVEELLSSVSNSTLPEYSYEWNYTTVSDAISIGQTIHVNNDVGGYIVVLHPKSLSLDSSYHSICFITNMDSVYGSPGFSSNAIGVVQSILALEELSTKPGLKNPITVVITDTKESHSDVLLNLYSLPELQKCAYSVILDSLGIAQTVPDAIHISDLNWKASRVIPRSNEYLRISNFILDTASTLSLLSSTDVTLMRESDKRPSFSKLSYSDSQFLNHSPKDTRDIAKAAAVKARYDRLIEIGMSLGSLDSSILNKPSTYLRHSYISAMGVTIRVSFTEEVIMIVVGLSLSFIFLRNGYMNSKAAVTSGIKKAQILLFLQIVVICLTIATFLIWFAIDPFISHKINYYIMSVMILTCLLALIAYTLQLNFYSNFFTRDYAGALMSTLSIVYGIIGGILLLFGLHSSLQFSIPCCLFGLTNLFLFLRKFPFCLQYKWRKALYAVSLVVCAVICFVVNVGMACATLHVTYGMVSMQDLTVNIVVVLAFWSGIFPMMFTLSCLKLIYFTEKHSTTVSSVQQLTVLVSSSVYEDEQSDDTMAEEKVVYRKYLRGVCFSFLILLLVVTISSSLLPPWNDDKPVPINAGITFISQELNTPSRLSWNNTRYGKFMISGDKHILSMLKEVVGETPLDEGYRIDNITKTRCYLAKHLLGPCLELSFSQHGSPVTFPLFEDRFNASRIIPVSKSFDLGNEPLNYTEYTKEFIIHIPQRCNTSIYGYPISLLKIYTTNVKDQDTKIFSNKITASIDYNNKTLSVRDYVVNSVINSNGDHNRNIPLRIRSRVGSQVIIRLTDVSRFSPPIMDVVMRGLGSSFIYSGLTDLSFLSHSTNYFIQY